MMEEVGQGEVWAPWEEEEVGEEEEEEEED